MESGGLAGACLNAEIVCARGDSDLERRSSNHQAMTGTGPIGPEQWPAWMAYETFTETRSLWVMTRNLLISLSLAKDSFQHVADVPKNPLANSGSPHSATAAGFDDRFSNTTTVGD